MLNVQSWACSSLVTDDCFLGLLFMYSMLIIFITVLFYSTYQIYNILVYLFLLWEHKKKLYLICFVHHCILSVQHRLGLILVECFYYYYYSIILPYVIAILDYEANIIHIHLLRTKRSVWKSAETQYLL